MRRYEVLFVCDDCVTTVPVPDALRGGGFRLHIAHGFHELAAHCGQRVDVIVILSQHHAIEWIARLKLLRNSVPVVVVCTGAQASTAMPPLVDAVCQTESLTSVLDAVFAAASSTVPVHLLQAQLAPRQQARLS
jgi:hypothetical protein